MARITYTCQTCGAVYNSLMPQYNPVYQLWLLLRHHWYGCSGRPISQGGDIRPRAWLA